jgi:NMD protein affecting ribosome stability and mRNA decay
MRNHSMQDQFIIICPYCGESVEIYLEPDVEGNLVQDCAVCCNPWEVNVGDDGESRYVSVSRSDGLG